MDEEDKSQLPEGFGLVLTETKTFTPEEMLACEKCARANPPTRLNCLYCGVELPTTAASAEQKRPALRPLDAWEKGFNVVITFTQQDEARGDNELDAAAKLLRIDARLFREFAELRDTLPVARAATSQEAEFVVKRLGELGFAAEIIADETLQVELRPPTRVRKIEMNDVELKGWTVSGEPVSISWTDLEIFAVGRIYTKRMEVEERKGRVKSGKEVADAREMFADETALEIYSRHNFIGWRIMSRSFDYSSLGEKMGLLAGENFKKLLNELERRAPNASFDKKYDGLRQLLSAVWMPSQRSESGGLKRERPGKFNTEVATIVTNDTQFTRYVRVRHMIASRRRRA